MCERRESVMTRLVDSIADEPHDHPPIWIVTNDAQGGDARAWRRRHPATEVEDEELIADDVKMSAGRLHQVRARRDR